MKRIIKICLIVIMLAFIVYDAIKLFQDNKTKEISYDENILLKETIDSLNNVCDSLNVIKSQLLDSLNKSDTQIVVITKQYEKDFNTIITQSVDSDCLFFANYLELSKDLK